MQPGLIRLRDAPRYVGMDKHRFNHEVRPLIVQIPIGKRGVAFDRLDLDNWIADYKSRKGVVKNILNKAAAEWIAENGLSWIAHPPKTKMLLLTDARKPYPLSWEEQQCLFAELPSHLRQMAIFKAKVLPMSPV